MMNAIGVSTDIIIGDRSPFARHHSIGPIPEQKKTAFTPFPLQGDRDFRPFIDTVHPPCYHNHMIGGPTEVRTHTTPLAD